MNRGKEQYKTREKICKNEEEEKEERRQRKKTRKMKNEK